MPVSVFPLALVILSEAKNLIISTESTIEILRLSPQNDITTRLLKEGEGDFRGLSLPAGHGLYVENSLRMVGSGDPNLPG